MNREWTIERSVLNVDVNGHTFSYSHSQFKGAVHDNRVKEAYALKGVARYAGYVNDPFFSDPFFTDRLNAGPNLTNAYQSRRRKGSLA